MDLERIKKLSGVTEGLGYEVTGTAFSSAREEEFLSKIEDIQRDIRNLKTKIESMHFAPSMEAKMSDSFSMMVDYFETLAKHARHNLRPPHFPKSRR